MQLELTQRSYPESETHCLRKINPLTVSTDQFGRTALAYPVNENRNRKGTVEQVINEIRARNWRYK